jgi:cytochrome c oxidase subunit 2
VEDVNRLGSARRGLLAVAGSLGVGALLAACSGSPSMLDPKSREAHHLSGLFWLMLVMAAAVYVAVAGFVVVAIVKRRRDTAGLGSPGHDTKRDHRFILIGGLIAPVAILSVLGVATVVTTNALRPPEGTVQVHVNGERWWWRVDYPGTGVVTANEVHVPVGEPVDISLTSDNVIHSFWVPQLNGKTDLVPGQTNHLSFTAHQTGVFRGECAEFCGIGHAKMDFRVVVDSAAQYQQWIAAQQRVPAAPTGPDAQRGQQLFTTSACAGCHRVAGTSAVGTAGPDLTHLASRLTLAAGWLDNTPDELSHWLADTQTVKPGALMPDLGLSADDVAALVAYLETLR